MMLDALALGGVGRACRNCLLVVVLTLGVSLACKTGPAPGAVELKAAEALMVKRDYASAITEFEKAESAGAVVPARTGIARAQERLGKIREAEASLKRVLAAEPANQQAVLSLARLQLTHRQVDEARATLRAALKLRPVNVAASLLFSALAVSKQDAELGLQTWDAVDLRAYSHLLRSAEFYVAKAGLLQIKGESRAAQQLLKEGANSLPASAEAAVSLSHAYRIAGKLEYAEWLLERVVSNAAAPRAAYEALAGLALELRHLDVAERSIGELPTEFKADIKALMLQAKLYEERGLHRARAEALRRALESLRKDAPPQLVAYLVLQRAAALSQAGDSQTAITELTRLVSQQPGAARARIMLAGVYLRKRDAKAAMQQLNVVLKQKRVNQALLEKALVFAVSAERMLGEHSQAEQLARRYVESSKGAPKAVAILAGVLDGAGKTPGAVKELQQALKLHPDSLYLAKTLAEVTYRTRGLKTALGVVQELMKQRKDPAPLYELEAELYVKEGRLEDAEQGLAKLASAQPERRTWMLLADVQSRQHKRRAALKSLQAAVRLEPRNENVRVKLANTLEHLGRFKEAEQVYESILKLNSKNVVALNNLSALLTRRKDGDRQRAIRLARDARELAPKNASIADTLGWALFVANDSKVVNEAVQLLRIAAAHPRQPLAHYHLGLALLKLGKRAEGNAELKEALSISGDFEGAPQAKNLLAQASR